MIILDKQKHPITMITKLLSARYYVSLMDFAQNLIFITSYIIYFKLSMIVLFQFNDAY